MNTIVKTDKAPLPVGTYNQGIITDSNKLLYTAGQIAIDPKTNEVIDGDVRDQTRLVLNNLREVLKAAGTEMSNMIKLTVFMVDLQHFNTVNEVFKEFFPNDPPARSAVEVSALPKGVDIEIEGIAAVP
ncbi:reactive intermediate/imine deaminase [candidate division KSB1 bacterium]|nr:reactive intermediate/imine deaminase [candidate division KSB1 bacterium]MCH8284913.1 reactive intermediate/imine deaminase [candidate division KSB1 bacterium]